MGGLFGHERRGRHARLRVHFQQRDAIALGNLRKQGFAVTAIVNVYEETRYAELAGPLVAEGIEVRQLKEFAAIPTLCSRCLVH